MKKRVLSVLLLLALVVAAVPLMAFAALASEPASSERTFTEDKYNALYVQDKLLFAMDFYRTNSYWNTTGASVNPSDYVWTTGCNFTGATSADIKDGYYNLADATSNLMLTNTKDGTAMGNSGTTGEWVGIFTDASDQNAFAMNDIRFKVSVPANSETMTISSVGQRTSVDGQLKGADDQFLAFTAPVYRYVNTVTVSHKTPTYTQTYYLYKYAGSTVVRPTAEQWNSSSWGAITTLDKADGQNYFFPTHTYEEGQGVKLRAAADVSRNMFAFYKPVYVTTDQVWDETANEGAGGYVTDPQGEKTYIVDAKKRSNNGTIAGGDNFGEPLTQGGHSDFYAATPGYFSMLVDGVAAYSSDSVYFPANSNITGDTYLRLYAKQDNSLYAFRQYAKVLSGDELAQNRFADLAKWFKLDLSYVLMLSDASLAELYTFAATLRFEDAASKTSLYNKSKSLAEAQYEGTVDGAIVAIAAQYDLDLAPLQIYPKGVLSSTFTYLLSEIKTSADPQGGYHAALAADLSRYYTANTMTAEDYDALYVQDGLTLAIDFFSTNDYWNTEGTVYTVPVGPSENSAYVYNGTTYNFTVDENRLADYVIVKKNGSKFEKLADHSDYATSEAANAALATLQSENPDATYEVRRITNAAFQQAYTEWMAADKAYLAPFVTYRAPGVTTYMASYNVLNTNDFVSSTEIGRRNTAFSVFTQGNGYVMLRGDYHTSGSLCLLESSSLPAGNNLSAQLIASLGGKLTSGVPLIFHNIRPNSSTYGTNYGFNRFFDLSAFRLDTNSFTPSFAVPNTAEDVVDLTYTLIGSDVAGGTDDVFMIRTEDGTAVSVTGTYLLTSASGKPNNTLLIGYNRGMQGLRVYAFRYYANELTDAEIRQNHFADLVKFFRLNISGFQALSETQKQAVYTAVAATPISYSSTRDEAQNAISGILAPYMKDAYASMKTGDPAVDAFVDLAAEYLMDLTDLFATKRDMSSVYETVTADALAGKTIAEAQAILDEAVFDAWNYLSYKVEGDDATATAWNAQMVWCAENCSIGANVDLEALNALPFSLRTGVLGNVPISSFAAAQAYIDAYVAEQMAAYPNVGAIDYDALYVQNGLISQIDFFKLNQYWGESYTLPSSPSDSFTGEKFDCDQWFVVKWTSAAKTAYHWVYNEAGDVTDSTRTGMPIAYTDIPGGKTAREQAEEKAAALRQSTNVDRYEALPYPTTSPSSKLSTEFSTVISQYLADVQEQLNSFVVKGDRFYRLTLPSISVQSYHDQLGNYQRAPFTYGDGYLQMDNRHANAFLLLLSELPTTGAVTGEYVLTSGTPRSSSAHFVQTGDVTIMTGTVNSEGISFTGFNSYGGSFGTSGGVKFASAAHVNISTTTPFGLATIVDRGNGSGSISGSLFVNGTQLGETLTGTDTSANTGVTQFGYSSLNNNPRLYAARFYDRALTTAEMARNHFADLAKFFRLDVFGYNLLTEEAVNELLTFAADYTLNGGDVARDALQAKFDEVLNAYYAEYDIVDDAEKNATFLEIATYASLNLDSIKNLDSATREQIVDAMIAAVDFNYATSRAVVLGTFLSMTKSYGALTFAGYQVRIDTGVESQNYAGVRAVFDIDTALIEDIVLNDGKEVSLVVFIKIGSTTVSQLALHYKPGTEPGTITVESRIGNDAAKQVTTYERQTATGTTTSFNYTVTYKSGLDADKLFQEYSYEYMIMTGTNLADDESRAVDTQGNFAVTSQTFGASVSAAALYGYFGETAKYADDAVVKGVNEFVNSLPR